MKNTLLKILLIGTSVLSTVSAFADDSAAAKLAHLEGVYQGTQMTVVSPRQNIACYVEFKRESVGYSMQMHAVTGCKESSPEFACAGGFIRHNQILFPRNLMAHEIVSGNDINYVVDGADPFMAQQDRRDQTIRLLWNGDSLNGVNYFGGLGQFCDNLKKVQ